MTTETDIVFLGVDWSCTARPQFRMMPVGGNVSYMVPALETPLHYRVSKPGIRFCCGWFNLAVTPPAHEPCETWQRVASGTQCARCRYREGFVTAHQAHRMSTELPQRIREYLAQPHWLYVDSFADGSLKVGTVAESRLDTRLAEQGALAARYVARASDGVAVRSAEEVVSHHFQLPQTVSSKRKLTALGSRVSIDEVTADLEALTEKVRVFMDCARGEIEDVEVMDVPRPWSLPACAELAFALTPLEQYQGKLVDGDHSIFLKAMTGSIAVFAIDEAPSAELFSVTLGPLYGMQLRLGDYWSSPSPMQTSLL